MTTWLLFVDLESTGLDTGLDEIIEAAFILVEADTLVEMQRWHKVLPPSTKGMERLLEEKAVREMHVASGLLSDIALNWGDVSMDRRGAAHDVQVFGTKVFNDITFREDFDVKTDVVHLAGSGIAAFDRPMMNRYMADLAGLLHYAPIDTGVLRRTWRMWTGLDASADNAGKNHRAMSDCEGSLNEARVFRGFFRDMASR